MARFQQFFNWLIKGNPVAKTGIILLFLGVAALLKLSIQHGLFTPGIRLLISATAGIVLLLTGWWWRKKNVLFAIILQDGAIG